jgi:hypothetical protein
MGFIAGQRLSGAQQDHYVQQVSAAATGTLSPVSATAPGSAQDCTGATVTFTIYGASAFVFVTGVFDMSKTAAAMQGYGLLNVDGTVQTPVALYSDASNTISDRCTVSQTWIVSLTAGSHTLKLQSYRTGGAGTFAVNATHTTINVLIVDKP